MKIETKSLDGSVLFEGDFTSVADALTAAVRRRANLDGANLARANLAGAYLAGAILAGANLAGVVEGFAQIAFKGHGECGRMLSAIRFPGTDQPKFFCGCFTGSESDLRAYIADGPDRLKKTRTLALDTVLMLLAAENDS